MKLTQQKILHSGLIESKHCVGLILGKNLVYQNKKYFRFINYNKNGCTFLKF